MAVPLYIIVEVTNDCPRATGEPAVAAGPAEPGEISAEETVCGPGRCKAAIILSGSAADGETVDSVVDAVKTSVSE